MEDETDKCFSNNVECNSNMTRIVDCDCLDMIRDCLHNINTTLPNKRTDGFFLNQNTKCYKNDYPIVRCLESENDILRRLNTSRCVRYELDESKPKAYQIFDEPYFYRGNNWNDVRFRNALEEKKVYFLYYRLTPEYTKDILLRHTVYKICKKHEYDVECEFLQKREHKFYSREDILNKIIEIWVLKK